MLHQYIHHAAEDYAEREKHGLAPRNTAWRVVVVEYTRKISVMGSGEQNKSIIQMEIPKVDWAFHEDPSRSFTIAYVLCDS